MFAEKTFKEWQKSGKDVHSIIADPLFENPLAFNFHFKRHSVVKKIRFVPFDYSRAGVYGSDEWIKLAGFDPSIAKEFDERVNMMENR
jgi:hypothetical protein